MNKGEKNEEGQENTEKENTGIKKRKIKRIKGNKKDHEGRASGGT